MPTISRPKAVLGSVSSLSTQLYLQRLHSAMCTSKFLYDFNANTGRFIMLSMITNIYNKKTKGPTLMEFFTATGKMKKFFFFF